MMPLKALTIVAATTMLVAASPAMAQSPLGIGYNGDHIEKLQVSGNSFNAELARDYRDLALYERDEMADWISTEMYADRALAAAANQLVLPLNPEDFSIADQQALAELRSGRAELVQVLDAGGRNVAPDIAALAQAKFDCWVEQQEEGWQKTHIAACRDDFLAALAALKRAMQPAEVQTEVAIEAEQVTVYFEFDKSNITPQAAQALQEFADLLPPKQNVRLVIAGHTDRAGSPEYNIALSRRRAEAVQDYLADLGVTATELAGIQILALGESDPAVPTPDGVRMPENRRVVVTVNQTN